MRPESAQIAGNIVETCSSLPQHRPFPNQKPPLRPGRASLLFAVGFEIEISKRWGRWISPASPRT